MRVQRYLFPAEYSAWRSEARRHRCLLAADSAVSAGCVGLLVKPKCTTWISTPGTETGPVRRSRGTVRRQPSSHRRRWDRSPQVGLCQRATLTPGRRRSASTCRRTPAPCRDVCLAGAQRGTGDDIGSRIPTISFPRLLTHLPRPSPLHNIPPRYAPIGGQALRAAAPTAATRSPDSSPAGSVSA